MAQTEYNCWTAKRDIDETIAILRRVYCKTKNRITKAKIKGAALALESIADNIVTNFDEEDEQKQVGLFE